MPKATLWIVVVEVDRMRTALNVRCQHLLVIVAGFHQPEKGIPNLCRDSEFHPSRVS